MKKVMPIMLLAWVFAYTCQQNELYEQKSPVQENHPTERLYAIKHVDLPQTKAVGIKSKFWPKEVPSGSNF